MKRLHAIACLALMLMACDASDKDRLSDEQATAAASGPEVDTIDQNLVEGSGQLNEVLDAASNAAIDQGPPVVSQNAAVAEMPKGDPNSPSFVCAGLLSRVEEMICTSPELARRDRIVAAEFDKAMAEGTAEQQDRLRVIGRRYLTDRNRCGDVDCVMQAYRWYARDIDGLMGWPPAL